MLEKTKKNIKNYLIQNKYRIILAFILAVVEFFFFVYPIGLGYYYKKVLTVVIFLTWLGVLVQLPKKVQFILGTAFLFITPVIMITWLEKMTQSLVAVSETALFYNMVLAFVIQIILFLFTLSYRISICTTSLCVTILYTINYFVYIYRGKAFSFKDLFAFHTAMEVVGGFDLTPSNIMIVAWSLLIMIWVWTLGLKVKIVPEMSKIKKRIVHLVGALLGVSVVVISSNLFLNISFWEERDIVTENGFLGRFYSDGYLVSTCIEWATSEIRAEEDYSTQFAQDILADYQGNSAEESPNIILILNESMADLRVWGNIELNNECMPFFDSLTDNTVRGYANASVLGGGTANTEFEVLFGASMALLPSDYYPYQQCVEPGMHSIVSVLADKGYNTYSIHPENKRNWNRAVVYQNLEFDESFWMEDFPEADFLNMGATDYETYKKIIDLYENKEKDAPLFVFDVTMQNHGGYTWANIEQDVKATNLDYNDLNNYLSLLHRSDQDFKQLIDYFTNVDEKVVICMFGDHQPKFENAISYDIICEQTPGLTEMDKVMNLYKTPFVMWANYDIEEQKDLDISMNYLGALLLETAGVNDSPYFNYLLDLMREYPIITINGYSSNNEQYSIWNEDSEKFKEYRILQYYQLFDLASRK